MTEQEPVQKELVPSFVVLEKNNRAEIQQEINVYISKWYIPYWQIMLNNDIRYSMCMIDPLVLEKQQLTVRNISNNEDWTIHTVGTIPGTVNVSWCECNCW